MSQDKTKVRIKHKHKTEENWLKDVYPNGDTTQEKLENRFIPLDGEVIIFDADSTHEFPRLKFGDGENDVCDLPFFNNAENVYFDDDITITTAVGNIGIQSNGQGIIPAKGKTVKQVFESIWTQEKDPTITQPSVSIDSSTQYWELGTTGSITGKATFSPGTYQYGPATGVTVTGWELNGTAVDSTSTTQEKTFADVRATLGDSFTFTAKAKHTAGADPVTNLGNKKSSLKIVEDTTGKSKSKVLLKGYRPLLYGFSETILSEAEITASKINSLRQGNSLTQQSATDSKKTYLKAGSSWKQFIYAVPKPDGKVVSLAATQRTPPAPFTVKSKTITDFIHQNGETSAYTVFYISLDIVASAGTEIDFVWTEANE